MYKPGSWDLSELAKNHKSARFRGMIKEISTLSSKFEKARSGLKPAIQSKRFASLLQDIELITEKTSIVGGYASLLYSADTQSDAATSLLTQTSKLGSEVENQTLFFDLWWERLDQKNADRLLHGAGQLAGYLRYKRLAARYSLSEPEEKIINTLGVTGVMALVKLYDKITNAFEYKLNGKVLTREELVNHVKSSNPKTRKQAYVELFARYGASRGVLGEIYQNIILNWHDVGVQMRGHHDPISVRNMSNDVDDGTVDSLLAACRKNSKIFQRYFAQKAKALRAKKLRRYDLYAPITDAREKRYSYDKSVRLVLESFGQFSSTLQGFARAVFEENHVDSAVRPGKRDGAFCSTISPGITPYVLVNFTGRTRDVFTLSHELGHAVHSMAAREKSILIQGAPLPLAETASTFSELLLYDNLSEKIPGDQKRFMLYEKLDDFYATIMRQSFFTLFEIEAHRHAAKGATTGEISEIYLKNLRQQFGSSVRLADDFAAEWSCIPHFYHAPFYCYAYSFGNLLALSLFQRYKKEGADFVDSYIGILSAGGSKKPETLLSEFGIDIASPGFWQQGFDYIDEQIRLLSKL